MTATLPLTTTRPITSGVRVRHSSQRALGDGLVLSVDAGVARVAFEGRLPGEVPVADLVRVGAGSDNAEEATHG